MRLKRLELQGFKSFPEKTQIDFDEGITAVVGPNGSGKSNIADAIRWVLGETSSKTLRGNKMEDVIFNGTDLRRPLGFAEVSLILDNTDSFFPVAFDELKVTRCYYRSGNSEYRINDAQVRLKDILDLFRGTGLGREGYSIIGQGAIAEVVTAKSVDRRFIFEEAVGISGFKYKKEESESQLAKTQENLVRVTDLMYELEGRLPSLEEKSRKARRYMDLWEERKDLEVNLWQRKIVSVAEDLKKAEENATLLQKDLEAAQHETSLNEQENNTLSERVQTLTASVEILREQVATLDASLHGCDAEILVAQNDISHIREDMVRLQTEAERAAESLSRLETESEEYRRKMDETAQQVAAEQQAMADMLIRQKTEQGEENAYLDRSVALNRQMDDLRNEIVEQQIAMSARTQQKQSVAERRVALQEEIADADNRIATISATRDHAQTELTRAQNIINDNRNRLQGYDLKLKSKREQAKRKGDELEASRVVLQDKTNRLKILSDLEQHYEGFQNSVRTVMREADRGVLKGIHGTVAQMIEVEPTYSVAVETALGGAIQHVITQDETAAKNAMFLLKNKNAGRATFLPLNVMKGSVLRENGVERQEGYVGIASDLVSYAPQYTQIIQFLLGRIVVTETVDHAIAIARTYQHRFKIVTLDGQVLNAGGSMTGGSVSRNMGILSRRNEIAALETEIEHVKETYQRLSEEMRKVTAETELLQKDVDGILGENKDAEEQMIRFRTEYTHCDASVKTVEEQKLSLNSSLDGLANEDAACDAAIEVAKQKIAETEAEIARLTSERDAIDAEFGTLRAKKEQLLEDLHRKEMEILELQKTAEQLRETLAQADLRRSDYDSEKLRIVSEITAAEERIAEKENEILEISARKANIQTEIESTKERIRVMVAERTETERKLTALREAEKALYLRREALSREIEKSEAGLANLRQTSETLVFKLWDEYELTLSEAEALRHELDVAEAEKRAEVLKSEMKALGTVDMSSIEEYVAVRERYDTMKVQYDDLIAAKTQLEAMIAELSGKMEELFSERLDAINKAFDEVFRELFNGGTAKLYLVEPDNILESGVEINVAPPGKIIKNLTSLSGGEQALTAIALYFAILKLKPSPFCLLDEIEAALDDVNVARYAAYLRRLSGETQFLTITHRRGTMEEADRLYGVTMVEKGVSKVITVNVNDLDFETA